MGVGGVNVCFFFKLHLAIIVKGSSLTHKSFNMGTVPVLGSGNNCLGLSVEFHVKLGASHILLHSVGHDIRVCDFIHFEPVLKIYSGVKFGVFVLALYFEHQLKG